MNIQEYKFPKIDGFAMAFSTLKTDMVLLAEAKERGFYDGNTPYNRLFSQIFFRGGKVKFKESISPEFKSAAWPYLKAFMASFEPKHEEKEAISALLLSELVEPELQEANANEQS